jgi:hypothetical protein
LRRCRLEIVIERNIGHLLPLGDFHMSTGRADGESAESSSSGDASSERALTAVLRKGSLSSKLFSFSSPSANDFAQCFQIETFVLRNVCVMAASAAPLPH